MMIMIMMMMMMMMMQHEPFQSVEQQRHHRVRRDSTSPMPTIALPEFAAVPHQSAFSSPLHSININQFQQQNEQHHQNNSILLFTKF
jgi:hypothetical protein